jgi:hypothetical protein
MRCDRGEEWTDHHSVFLVGTGAPGHNHSAFETANIDDTFLGHFHLARNAEYRHEWGIGRHILGGQVFDYWTDPFGFTVEHWSDGDQLNGASGSNFNVSIRELMDTQWGPTVVGSRLGGKSKRKPQGGASPPKANARL